jgi:hypothetical protein
MRWGILLLVVLATGCNSGSSEGSHVDVGCTADAGNGCTEDTQTTGICAQDKPHLCYCGANGNTATPSPSCVANAVKPYAPYARAYCCP